MSLSESIKEINEEVKKINRNFFLYYNKNKSSKTFIVAGVSLIAIGFMLLQYLTTNFYGLIINFILGFLVMMLITIGFSLMHKSLRGAWL